MTLTKESLIEKKADRLQRASSNEIAQPKIAYITSKFPEITETFILYEMLALKKQGVQIELYPFIRSQTEVVHAEAKEFIDQAHFQPFISWPIVRSHLNYILRKPKLYLHILWKIIGENWGSVRFLSRALAIFPLSVYLSELMKSQGIQHIHAHFASHPAAAAYVIHRLAGIPFSFTAHGTDLHRDRHMLSEKVSKAEFVITISEYNKRLIISECGAEIAGKVFVIHCGVDTEFFKPSPGYSHNSDKVKDSGSISIVCVGTLHEVKGQKYLIEACKILRERGVSFTCHFVGDGPDWHSLTRQVSTAGLDDQVKFHGRLNRDEIANLLRDVDVLVAPSVRTGDGRREGIPVVLMEAMSSGLAVVASDISGIPELVQSGKTGLLVPPRNERKLADALEELHRNDDLRQSLGKHARFKVIQDFHLDGNASALLELFKASARKEAVVYTTHHQH